MTSNLYDRQIDLEIEMTGYGDDRFRTRFERDMAAGRGTDTKAGRYVVSKAVPLLAENINSFLLDAFSGRPGPRQRAAVLLKDMDPHAVAYITCRTIYSVLLSSQSKALLSVAKVIGNNIQDEARFSEFEKSAPGLYAVVNNDLSARGSTPSHRRTVLNYAMGKFDISWDRWNSTDILHLGVRLVELFQEATGDIEISRINELESAKSQQFVIHLSEQTRDWMGGVVSRNEGLEPFWMPMVHPPKPWTDMSGGGYLSNLRRPTPLVRPSPSVNGGFQKRLLDSSYLGAVRSCLNAVQDTAWQINPKVLSVMEGYLNQDVEVAGLVSGIEEPLPEKPADISYNETSRKEWKWAARDVHQRNVSRRQERLRQMSLLSTALKFKDEAAIYFPHNLDFRGRVYPIPLILNPQGDDRTKSLLQFTEGKPLGSRGKRWLFIHGANCFGVDKVSFKDRVEWVNQHRSHILHCAKDPHGYRWWTEADKPWCFLAFCFEYEALDRLGEEVFVSHLPVALDGSCNGLQHFSAMLLDKVGGEAVNLLPSDKPKDIYQTVCDRVIQRMQEITDDPESTEEQVRWAYGWKHFGLDRKVTKRPVMVLPYGGTPRSCLKYVKEAVMDKINAGTEHNFGEELNHAIGMLSTVVWEAIGDVVIAARAAMNWLQNVTRLVNKLNKPMIWTTPSGFVVYQFYPEYRKRLIKTKLMGSMVRFVDKKGTKKVDKSKQTLAVSPNYVHSLDGAALALTVDRLAGRGITSFAMIHDSYGTHATDCDLLASTLREVFVEMYSTDPLKHLRDEIVERYPEIADQIPPIPTKGELDLNLVLKSDFFFA